jgi:hypothetical protein
MALPTYNAAKHELGLGGYGFPCTAYAKRGQENPVSRVAVGSDDFLATDRSSFWTQEDYSGGSYQYEWHDQAMVATCENVWPNQLSHAVRTSPRLALGKSLNATGVGAVVAPTEIPLAAFTIGNAVTFCFKKRMITAVVAGNGVITTTLDAHGVTDKTCYCYSDEEELVYAGGADGKIYCFVASTMALSKTIDNIIEGTTSTRTAGACQLVAFFGDQLFAAWANYLYVQAASGKWQKVNGGSTRPRAGRLSGYPIAAVPYNGQLYILLARPNSFEGSIVATTGTQIVGICDIPYSMQPKSLCEYAGRLYVGCLGTDMDDTSQYGELYELTGTSLRLVRSFMRERLTQGPVTGPIASLDVADGFLVFPNSSRQAIELYDASNDAFFTGPALPMAADFSRPYPGLSFGRVSSIRDQLLVWANHATNRDWAGIWRHRVGSEANPNLGSGSYIMTSDFDPEPGRLKQWGKLVVKTRNFPCAWARVSTDGGVTWTSLPQPAAGPNAVSDGDVRFWTYQLAGYVAPSRRLRLQLWMLPTNGGTFGEFLAHTLSYVFQEHDKHGWQVTIPCVWGYEQLDETIADPAETPAQKLAQLWSWANNGQQVTYRDRDGAVYTVVLTQCVESEPVLNPSGQREAYFSCYLLEV